MKQFILKENQLLRKEHYPVGMVINTALEDEFPLLLSALSTGEGYANEGGSLSFWDSLDDYEKETMSQYEGILFEAEFGTNVVISYLDMLTYIEVACIEYLRQYRTIRHAL